VVPGGYLHVVSTLAEERAGTGRENLAVPELSALRVLLVHEWLYTWAGAERCLEQILAMMPHADVLAGIVTPAMRAHHRIARQARETWVGRIPGARRHHRWFLPLHALAFSRFDTSEYDLVVSISHAFEKAVRARKPGAIHVSYCLSPPRYLWDLSDTHDQLAAPLQRMALRVGRTALRAADRRAARGVHHFVSLSRVVADRVQRAYGRESTVVYPPVTPKGHQPLVRTNRSFFLLSLGRLVPYKRVDLAIDAAERLRIPLVIAGDGPDRRRLEGLVGPFTEIRGTVSEEEAAELLSSCAAFVFCAEDDFGIAPLEANAHGAPVIAFGRGGALETLEDGRTGVFYQEQTVEALSAAITRCLSTTWNEDDLRRNAERFAPDRFRDGFRRALLGATERG
jgi:glycosyltransferase involved in cell wall biosynthesis